MKAGPTNAARTNSASTNSVRPVAWQAPRGQNDAGETLIPPPMADQQSRRPDDFFSDPFGDDPLPPGQSNAYPIPEPQSESLIEPPSEAEALPGPPANELRVPAPQRSNMFERVPATPQAERPIEPPAAQREPMPNRFPDPNQTAPESLPQPTPEPLRPPTAEAQPRSLPQPEDLPETPERISPPAPEPNPTDEPSLGDRLREETPEMLDREDADDENPFGDFEFDDERSRDRADRDRMNKNADDDRNDDTSDWDSEIDDDLERPEEPSCEDFRQRIAAQTIDQVSLDISPPYRPDEIDLEDYAELKAEFDEKQPIRDWRTIEGTKMAAGRLRDLAYEQVIIENDQGDLQELPIDELSEGDRAYIAENWGLPNECLLEQVAPQPRNWVMTTMTWKASNLCHTPLYFQDVNLERYGHTHGPVLEPLVQSAHFFGNVLVLPYKMGVHSPHECVYPLGYYRPGNCAPWIKQPVPISAKGALTQGITMAGLFWLVP